MPSRRPSPQPSHRWRRPLVEAASRSVKEAGPDHAGGSGRRLRAACVHRGPHGSSSGLRQDRARRSSGTQHLCRAHGRHGEDRAWDVDRRRRARADGGARARDPRGNPGRRGGRAGSASGLGRPPMAPGRGAPRPGCRTGRGPPAAAYAPGDRSRQRGARDQRAEPGLHREGRARSAQRAASRLLRAVRWRTRPTVESLHAPDRDAAMEAGEAAASLPPPAPPSPEGKMRTQPATPEAASVNGTGAGPSRDDTRRTGARA